MRRLLLVGAVLATSLSAGPAHADHEIFDCGFSTPQRESLSGDTYTAVAYGYLLATPGQDVSIRCYITRDGVEVPNASISGSGPAAALAYGQVTYTATDEQIVVLCTEWTVTNADGSLHHHGDYCIAPDPMGLPPQEVIDLVESIQDLIADVYDPMDPLVCGGLKTLGTPFLVDLGTEAHGWSMDADDCDVYYRGEKWLDFMPYGDPPTP